MDILQTIPDLHNSHVPEGLAKLNATQGGNEYTCGQLQQSLAEIRTPTYWKLITLSITTPKLCYLPAVFFCHLCVNVHSFPQGKIWHVFQTRYSSDFLKFFLKMHQVWNCAHWGVLVNNGNGHGTPTDVTWVHKPEKVGNSHHKPYATHHVNQNWQDCDIRVSLCCCQFWQHQIGTTDHTPYATHHVTATLGCHCAVASSDSIRLATLVIHLMLLTMWIKTDRTVTFRCHCAVASSDSIRLATLVLHLMLLTMWIKTDRTATLRCLCAIASSESIRLAIVQGGQSLSLQTLQTPPATQTVTITGKWLWQRSTHIKHLALQAHFKGSDEADNIHTLQIWSYYVISW